MKKLLVLLLILSTSMLFGQIAKTGGLLYSNGNPNSKGIDTLVTKNLSKNSEVCIDYTTGTIYTFDRSDSSFVKYDSRPYKVYTALLTQTGTDAPVATVLENTLGDTILWERLDVGTYNLNCASCNFLNTNLVVECGDITNADFESSNAVRLGFSYSDSSNITFFFIPT